MLELTHDVISYAKIGPIQHGIVHRWPEESGGTSKSFPYLANLHCHILEFTFSIQQYHNDREIEYLELHQQLKRCITFALGGSDYHNSEESRSWSCETIADKVMEKIIKEIGLVRRWVSIFVFEDGRNGCQKIYMPKPLKETVENLANEIHTEIIKH